jgi:predicted Rdx family selenoprotein
MSNHLEQLTAEWLEHCGYFVRQSVLVGTRMKGGFEGELDIVALNPTTRHLLHVECSLDAHTWERREARFEAKFERGQKYVPKLFAGFDIPPELDQVALLQFGGGSRTTLGGARLIWVADFVAEVITALRERHPSKAAVPSTLPLLRTLQLAAHFSGNRDRSGRLVPIAPNLANRV